MPRRSSHGDSDFSMDDDLEMEAMAKVWAHPEDLHLFPVSGQSESVMAVLGMAFLVLLAVCDKWAGCSQQNPVYDLCVLAFGCGVLVCFRTRVYVVISKPSVLCRTSPLLFVIHVRVVLYRALKPVMPSTETLLMLPRRAAGAAAWGPSCGARGATPSFTAIPLECLRFLWCP